MIWSTTFADRLNNWNQLRSRCLELPLESALGEINVWWFSSPWRPYYLHWDDQSNWPDPWQLLSDDVYCDLARGLGILYTISMLDRADMADAELILTKEGDNLVQVAKEKYILNWNKESIVNKNLELTISRQYQQHQIT